MKSLRYFTILLSLLFIPLSTFSAETPRQVIDKAISKINGIRGIKASFNISGNEFSNVSGSFEGNKQKFKLSTPQGITWYNGTDMWTSNVRSKQITLVHPTVEEINEVNPFAYLNSYKGKYKVFFSKRKDANRYLVLLNPVNSNDNIKAVEIAINKKTYLPERFIIRYKNDKRTTVTVTSLNTNYNATDAIFVCPVNNMKDYELIDLR